MPPDERDDYPRRVLVRSLATTAFRLQNLLPSAPRPETGRPKSSGEMQKLVNLELVRIAAAISVLIFHYYTHASQHNTALLKEQLPLYFLLGPIYRHGLWAVPVFWCMSGFIFFFKYQDAIFEKAIGWKKFFFLRFSRLYPLHLVTLLIVATLQLLYCKAAGKFYSYPDNDLGQFLLQLFMASSWGSVRLSFNGPIWSVSVEVLIYALFFLVLRLGGRSVLVNVSVIAAGMIYVFFGGENACVSCAVMFYAGGLGAIAARRFPDYRMRHVLLLSVTLMAFFTLGAARWAQDDLRLFGHLAVTFNIPVLLFCLARIHIPWPAIVADRIVRAGDLTYASYLIHFPVQLIVALLCLLMSTEIPVYNAAYLFTFLAVVLVGSYIVHSTFEEPARLLFRRIGANLSTGRSAAVSPAFASGEFSSGKL